MCAIACVHAWAHEPVGSQQQQQVDSKHPALSPPYSLETGSLIEPGTRLTSAPVSSSATLRSQVCENSCLALFGVNAGSPYLGPCDGTAHTLTYRTTEALNF